MRLALILAFFLACSGTGQTASRAENVLPSIQHAIDTSDMNLFERHVAVDALLDQGTSSVVSALQSSSNTKNLPLPPMLSLMAASVQDPVMATQVKNLLKQEAANFVRFGVTSGAFAGHTVDTSPNGLIAPLMRDASVGRKEIRSRGASRKSGEFWIVPAQIRDDGNGRTYAVDLKVKLVDGAWKVMEIANMDALVSKLRKEAAE